MDFNDLILSDAALNVIDGGTWMGDFDEAPGVKLLVTGMQADAAQKLMASKQAALRAKHKGKVLTTEQNTRVVQEVLAEVVLKDWQGLTQNGQPLPYSKELALQWLTSRNGEKFTGLVLNAAARVDAQAADLAKELEKN